MYPFSKALKGIMAMVIAISVAACSGGDGSVRTRRPLSDPPTTHEEFIALWEAN